jgi:hypothetical protein
VRRSPASGLFAERLGANFPAAANDGALLRWGLSGGSAPVEPVEGMASESFGLAQSAITSNVAIGEKSC